MAKAKSKLKVPSASTVKGLGSRSPLRNPPDDAPTARVVEVLAGDVWDRVAELHRTFPRDRAFPKVVIPESRT